MLTLKDGLGFGYEGDTYAALADADDFHADRGNSDWAAASETVREQKLILATDWLDMNWTWRTDVDGVPAQVARAAMLLAREALTTPLAAAQDDRQLKRERVKVEGAIEEEREYEPGSAERFPWIVPMLSPYGTHSGSTGSSIATRYR